MTCASTTKMISVETAQVLTTLVKTGWLARAQAYGLGTVAGMMLFMLILSMFVPLTAPISEVQAAPSSVIPATFFGMHTSGQSLPGVPYGAHAKGTLVRWIYVEHQKGVFDWSNLDAWVNFAQANGKGPIFYSTDGIPAWATSDTSTCTTAYGGVQDCKAMVKDIADWDNFITALATRYRGKLMYELWNEPNTIYFSGTVNDMVTLTIHAYNIIRQIDPSAIIISPSGTASYMDRYWAAGGPKNVDVVSFHGYYSDAEDVLTDISAMKSVMAKYGLSGKPIWDTEGSWGISSYYGVPDSYPGFIARYYLLHWSNDVLRQYWYVWDGTWGQLVNYPDYIAAYIQIYNWMVGATMTTPCAANNTVYTCTLSRSNYQGLAVWNTAGPSSFSVPSGYTQYRNLAGGTTQLNGVSSVTIGIQPILLENLNTGTPTPTPTPNTVRIEAGGTTNYTDAFGNVWNADTDFNGGNTIDRGNIAIANTINPRIYQTERYCMQGYTIPVANGPYTVLLHFAETNGDPVGARVFDVHVGGQTLNNLDVAAQAGQNTALVKTFNNVSVTTGSLPITFTQHAGSDCPEINGVVVVPAGIQVPMPPTNLRVVSP